MELISFLEQNIIIAENQPEYLPMPAHRLRNDPYGTVTCCWKLTWKERLQLLMTGKIWHQILTFNQPLQPVMLSIEQPVLSKE